jgi:hypothetical protein
VILRKFLKIAIIDVVLDCQKIYIRQFRKGIFSFFVVRGENRLSKNQDFYANFKNANLG